ncbi:MAG: fumarylacetoacetate hydrolase family protein [Massilia sp.]
MLADRAESHVFDLCLLNDWSARDVQAWEYQPLGTFLSMNFVTTIPPWIVTLEALAPIVPLGTAKRPIRSRGPTSTMLTCARAVA